MKLSWGWKIAVIYGAFAISILVLVVASTRQQFDLVAKDYYKQEIGYQSVLDAGHNQAMLAHPVSVHADASSVIFEFPEEFRGKPVKGSILFYSPVNAAWDKKIAIAAASNSMAVPRTGLQNTRYTVKVSCEVEGKTYYQESEIILHP